MKRGKPVLAFIMALIIICMFCSCKAMRESALRAREEPAADAASGEITDAPSGEATDAPSGEATDAPSGETTDAAYDYAFMAFNDEEMTEIFALFCIEDRYMEGFATLEFLSISLDQKGCSVDLTYNMDKQYEEVEAALMDHIEGDWETDGDDVYIYKIEDDFSVSCYLFKNDEEIWFSYMTQFEVPFIRAALTAHWPPVLTMPEELSGQPDSSMLMMHPQEGHAMYILDWDLKDEEEAGQAFESLSGSLEGNDIFSSRITEKGKDVLYDIQGLFFDIQYEGNTLSITCILT